MEKDWYELRVRERDGPNRWVKKSKFYQVNRPADAIRLYEKRCKIEHTIMWCTKDRRHGVDRLIDQAAHLLSALRQEESKRTPETPIGFLGLGDTLLRELRSQEREKVIKRRKYVQSSKETTY